MTAELPPAETPQGNNTSTESISPEELGESPPSASTTAQPLSKSAQKRLAKEARKAEHRLVWRAKEKEKKKQKQAEKRRLREEEEAAGSSRVDEDGQPPAKRARIEYPKRVPFEARVVIDLGFDDKMTMKEVNSLCSQLNHAHSANKKTLHPIANLLVTGLNGRAKERLDSINEKSYLRWRGVDFWEEGYERLWEQRSPGDTAEDSGTLPQDAPQATTGEEGAISAVGTKGRRPREHVASKDSVVYLTADSENEITELQESGTYIIGGIVDKNRYKNLCQNKAVSQGIRTARLPIGRYLANMPTRKVLTVNQVFEILVRWVDERDWEKALLQVVPKRKFKDHNAEVSSENAADMDEDFEEDEMQIQGDEGEDTPEDTTDLGDGTEAKGGSEHHPRTSEAVEGAEGGYHAVAGSSGA